MIHFIYIYMFRLTLKDFLSIIGSINTCVPNSLPLSLSLLLYTILLFERFALLLPLLTYCVSDSGLHLLFMLPLFVITVFLCVYISMQYCHLNTSLFIVYLNHVFNHHFLFFLSFLPFFSSFRRVLTLILKLSTLLLLLVLFSFLFFFSLLFFFLILLTRHYHLFYHYSGSQCYYCFMCSLLLLACRLAGTDCKNKQLPKILILE